MRTGLPLGLLFVLLLPPDAHSEPPVASYIFPAGGQRGRTVDFHVGGLFLHKSCSFEMLGPGLTASTRLLRTNTLWFEGPLLPLPESQQAEDYPKDLAGRLQIAADTPLGLRYWRLWNAQGATTAQKFMVGDLPEIVEHEIEGAPVPVDVRLPVTINGRIFPRENVDVWSFDARKGQTIRCEVYAARLGSPLDSRLEVLDPNGRRLGENDDTFGADSFLRFTAPSDGKYQVRIHDINFHGGQAYVYRLTLQYESAANPAVPAPSPPTPLPRVQGRGEQSNSPLPRVQGRGENSRIAPSADFQLRLASDVLAINRGSQSKLKILAERQGGFAEPIALAVNGLPLGVTAVPTVVPAGQNQAEIAFKVEPTAAIQGARLTIEGSAKVGGRLITRRATFGSTPRESAIDSLLLAVTVPTPFKIAGDFDMRWAPRGTVYQRHYRIVRGRYQGPLEVSLTDRQARHLQGVNGPTITVPAGVNEFDYAVQLPPWMETGRTARACIMAVGTIKDSVGNEHYLTFSTTEQNEQIIAVVEPGRLGVETERGSLLAEPGKTISLPVRITRGKSLQGPVKLEVLVAAHLQGIAAEAVTVAPDKTSATIAIHFANKIPEQFNTPLVLRATILDKGEPVVGEAKIDVLPPP